MNASTCSGKKGKLISLRTASLDTASGLQGAGPDANDLAFHEQGREERQADHMIDVAVAQEDVEVGAVGRLTNALPSGRIPVPASKIRVYGPQRTSTQGVLPP